MDVKHADRDNLRTLTAMIDTPVQRAESAFGDDWGVAAAGNLIALSDGHRAGFGPSIRRSTPGITRKMIPNWTRGLDQIQ
jgi:hypothetical protein